MLIQSSPENETQVRKEIEKPERNSGNFRTTISISVMKSKEEIGLSIVPTTYCVLTPLGLPLVLTTFQTAKTSIS
jgi:hypothetical protein